MTGNLTPEQITHLGDRYGQLTLNAYRVTKSTEITALLLMDGLIRHGMVLGYPIALVWCDVAAVEVGIYPFPDGEPARLEWMGDATDADPLRVWAAQFFTARAASDRATLNALWMAVHHDAADHLMALLRLCADVIATPTGMHAPGVVSVTAVG
jgi:hypothetical protein